MTRHRWDDNSKNTRCFDYGGLSEDQVKIVDAGSAAVWAIERRRVTIALINVIRNGNGNYLNAKYLKAIAKRGPRSVAFTFASFGWNLVSIGSWLPGIPLLVASNAHTLAHTIGLILVSVATTTYIIGFERLVCGSRAGRAYRQQSDSH